MERYVGRTQQVRGAELYTLEDGTGKGMRMLYVRNGRGLEAWISLDRAGDLVRVSYHGKNLGWFSPCGFVAPEHYGTVGYARSFTAGFCYTVGLDNAGVACEDAGEVLPQHGTLSMKAATVMGREEDKEGLTVKLQELDGVMFGRKLVLNRVYRFSYTEDTIVMEDTVINEGDTESPCLIMYHCNMGYPLLGERCELTIPHDKMWATTPQAKANMDTAMQMESPQDGYEERCYFYDIADPRVDLYNPEIGIGMTMTFDKDELPCFTEWKMMGKTEYVLGLEPANCTPDGRNVLRENGTLKFLNPDESKTTEVKFIFTESPKEFKGEF